jgi:hypothetical protein
MINIMIIFYVVLIVSAIILILLYRYTNLFNTNDYSPYQTYIGKLKSIYKKKYPQYTSDDEHN